MKYQILFSGKNILNLSPDQCYIQNHAIINHVIKRLLCTCISLCIMESRNTVEPQWLEHLWDCGNSFETQGSSSH